MIRMTDHSLILKNTFDISFSNVQCSMLSVDSVDTAGERHTDVSHNVYKRRLDSDGANLGDRPEKSADVGNVMKLASNNGPTLGDSTRLQAAEGEYCGPCYGALESGECCNSCEALRVAFEAKGWPVPPEDTLEQCLKESSHRSLSSQHGEGCRLYGHLAMLQVPFAWLRLRCFLC